MGFLVVGLSHKTAPLELREKLSAEGEKGTALLKSILDVPGVSEALVLSTCNRVEAYLATPGCNGFQDASGTAKEVTRLLAAAGAVNENELGGHVYRKEGDEAVAHAFRVASSLDSMVVGETQITGQMKEALARAAERNAVGASLNKLVQRALYVSKRVRTETGVGQQPVSIGYAAVLLAEKIFGDLTGTTVLLLGAGEMGTLAAKHLMERNAGEVRISNRTEERAAELARELKAFHVPFSGFPDRLDEVDIVIASTAADGYVIGKEQVREAMRRRRNRPMFFIDISVPRNVDPAVHELESVYLYDIDHLQGIVDANRKEREKEAKKAEVIVAQEVRDFAAYAQQRELSPTIRGISEKFERIRRGELEKYLPRVPGLTAEQREALEACTKAIVNKILHEPILTMKTEAGEGSSKYSEILRKLFRLESDEE